MMNVIRVTKLFTFEAAHTLDNYDGACREIHGHSYRLSVTVKGTPCHDEQSPKNGMVVDFGALKAIVNRLIIDRLDHSLIIRSSERNAQLIESLHKRFSRIETVDYQPTCENMISHFAEMLSAAMPSGIELHSLRLYETATSYAEWFAEDNRQ